MEENVPNLTKKINSLSYRDKLHIYQGSFSFGNFNTSDLNDRLILISLVSLTYKQMKKKNPTITPLDILIKISKQEDDGSSYYQFLETLAIIVEDFSYDSTKIDSCGLNNSKDIINKIKELLDRWLPF